MEFYGINYVPESEERKQMTDKSIAYVIYNTRSEYYYNQYEKFSELSFKTKIFPSRKTAERFLPVAIRAQIYELLEQIYEKSRFEIDITQEEYENIKEHVVLEVRPCELFVPNGEKYGKD